jgi:uncharacterized membrane protein
MPTASQPRSCSKGDAAHEVWDDAILHIRHLVMRPVHQFVHHRPRLVIAIVIGAAISVCLPSDWQAITRALTGWNVGVWAYLFSTAWLVLYANHEKVRAIAEREDNTAVAVLSILSIAAIVSLAAIVFELATSRTVSAHERLGHYAFTVATVLGSWLLVGTLFTFHYARAFYNARADARPLSFPDGEPNPDYWDFLYFSFTIAVAVQTSDVVIKSRSMRKLVLAQSVLSFLFNAAILGLSINIAAGLVGP